MWRRSSCRLRRYHGAFDGFGVQSGVAWSWSGALNAAAMTKSPIDQSDELDHEKMRPDHRGVLDALVDAHHRVLPHKSEQPEPLLLSRKGLGTSGSRQGNCATAASERWRVSRRASAPSAPEHVADGSSAGARSQQRGARYAAANDATSGDVTRGLTVAR